MEDENLSDHRSHIFCGQRHGYMTTEAMCSRAAMDMASVNVEIAFSSFPRFSSACPRLRRAFMIYAARTSGSPMTPAVTLLWRVISTYVRHVPFTACGGMLHRAVLCKKKKVTCLVVGIVAGQLAPFGVDTNDTILRNLIRC